MRLSIFFICFNAGGGYIIHVLTNYQPTELNYESYTSHYYNRRFYEWFFTVLVF